MWLRFWISHWKCWQELAPFHRLSCLRKMKETKIFYVVSPRVFFCCYRMLRESESSHSICEIQSISMIFWYGTSKFPSGICHRGHKKNLIFPPVSQVGKSMEWCQIFGIFQEAIFGILPTFSTLINDGNGLDSYLVFSMTWKRSKFEMFCSFVTVENLVQKSHHSLEFPWMSMVTKSHMVSRDAFSSHL